MVPERLKSLSAILAWEKVNEAYEKSNGGSGLGFLSSVVWSSQGSHASKLRYKENTSCSVVVGKVAMGRCLGVGGNKGSMKTDAGINACIIKVG
jgi:hypothetical protein